jgi:hypothetical protein
MIYPPTTHPLRHHPATPLLGEGEMVYKLSGQVDIAKLRGLYKSYHYMTNKEVYNTYIRHNKDSTIAKNNVTKELIKISTKSLGYISSQYTKLEDIYNPNSYGYKVRWQDYLHEYTNYEDEIMLAPLKDITILDPDDLASMFR